MSWPCPLLVVLAVNLLRGKEIAKNTAAKTVRNASKTLTVYGRKVRTEPRGGLPADRHHGLGGIHEGENGFRTQERQDFCDKEIREADHACGKKTIRINKRRNEEETNPVLLLLRMCL